MIQARIVEVMSFLRLTAVALAENIGVQPSSVSHILSGRNKPSLDFVNKLLSRYPQIDSNWLLRGEGKMIKSDKVQSSGANLSLFPKDDESELEFEKSDSDKILMEFDSNVENKKPIEKNEPPVVNVRAKKKIKSDVPSSTSASEREIKRIVIFYSDNSFEEFLPKNT